MACELHELTEEESGIVEEGGLVAYLVDLSVLRASVVKRTKNQGGTEGTERARIDADVRLGARRKSNA